MSETVRVQNGTVDIHGARAIHDVLHAAGVHPKGLIEAKGEMFRADGWSPCDFCSALMGVALDASGRERAPSLYESMRNEPTR